MKQSLVLTSLFSAILVFALASLVGCDNEKPENPASPANNPVEGEYSISAVCTPTTWTLWAGQTKNVGTVSVTNDATNLYVTYSLTYEDAACVDGVVDAYFGTLHMWAGNDLANLPSVANGPNAGTPIPGQFCGVDPLFCYTPGDNSTTTYTFTIPLANLGITDITLKCGTSIYVVTHAEVKYLNCDGTPSGDGDTGFGGDNPINVEEPGRWWYFGTYGICCGDGPVDPFGCKTAFGKGGYVFTTDRKSNPESLPSLNLTKNRWGWAINLTVFGQTTYDIWAGAGLNKTSNGTKVGTLTVNWDGTTAVVDYELNAGYCLDEVHLYAGDTMPTTVAPGQYGNLASPDVAFYQFVVDLSDTDGDGVWLIAHSVVCTGVCN